MTRPQILLVVIAVIATVLIYQLPRVVVSNEPTSEMQPHNFSISEEDQAAFVSLRQLLKESVEIKKSINFADSLASLSLKYRMTDSAAVYAGLIAQLDTADETRYKAANIYYAAFQAEANPEKGVQLAQKARFIYEDLVKTWPQNSSLKNKLAMTLMTSENPMAGVQLLREILADNPRDRETLLNMGLLAIRSGQYDRAIGRFEELQEIDSTDHESVFYLGVAYTESGQTEKAKETFEALIALPDADPALKATAANYLKEF